MAIRIKTQSGGWRSHGVMALLAAVCFMSGYGNASEEVPKEIAALLPAKATLDSGSWGVFDTEFGKTFNANMRAEFPGYPSSCDFTVGPELRVEIKGDTAWEEPPMLDMAVQMFESSIEQSRTSLPDTVAKLRQSNSHIKTIGAVQEEPLAGGQIVAVEFTEDCPSRPKGTNTELHGFARKGATILEFSIWISAGAAEAKGMAKDILEGFQKLDFAPLLNAK